MDVGPLTRSNLWPGGLWPTSNDSALSWQLKLAKPQPVDNWTTTTRQQTTRRAELNTLSKQCDLGESDYLGESVYET